METNSTVLNKSNADKKVEFKDLQFLLQQCFGNRDLEVVDYNATKLLPAGENYGSIMVKIDAKIRAHKNEKEEILHLVGKTPSCSEKPVLSWSLIFQKELFVYAELLPLYRELEKEVGIDDKNLINLLPKFIGYRNSLKDNSEADKDSVILMENLKVQGFYIVNKQIGMDVHHARKALTFLARYHALGIVMKQKRPSFAEKTIKQAGILGIDFAQVDNLYTSTCEYLMKILRSKKYLSIIESTFEQAKCGGCWKTPAIEPWATIIHGDFWTNNMLFHKDHEGNVDDVKFVDFQTYIYSSPLKDVSRFLGCSIDVETQTNHLEELLNLYYDVFVNTLKRMNCDTSSFTKESFDCEVKKTAIIEFPICVLAYKFYVSEVIDDNKTNEENMNNVLNEKSSDDFIERLMWLIKIYERMNWF